VGGSILIAHGLLRAVKNKLNQRSSRAPPIPSVILAVSRKLEQGYAHPSAVESKDLVCSVLDIQ
jgi:hypothetical protein